MSIKVLEGCLAHWACSVDVSYYFVGLAKGRWLDSL